MGRARTNDIGISFAIERAIVKSRHGTSLWRPTYKYVTAFLGASTTGHYKIKGKGNFALYPNLYVSWRYYLHLRIALFIEKGYF